MELEACRAFVADLPRLELVVYRLPLAAAREVHTRIDAGGLGGKIVLLPWPP